MGIEICHLWQGGPDVALLRFAAGSSVPWHRHTGLEMILVLSGSQSDEVGAYSAGTLVFNPEGLEHSVWSIDGCTVMIPWVRPVAVVV